MELRTIVKTLGAVVINRPGSRRGVLVLWPDRHYTIVNSGGFNSLSGFFTYTDGANAWFYWRTLFDIRRKPATGKFEWEEVGLLLTEPATDGDVEIVVESSEFIADAGIYGDFLIYRAGSTWHVKDLRTNDEVSPTKAKLPFSLDMLTIGYGNYFRAKSSENGDWYFYWVLNGEQRSLPYDAVAHYGAWSGGIWSARRVSGTDESGYEVSFHDGKGQTERMVVPECVADADLWEGAKAAVLDGGCIYIRKSDGIAVGKAAVDSVVFEGKLLFIGDNQLYVVPLSV